MKVEKWVLSSDYRSVVVEPGDSADVAIDKMLAIPGARDLYVVNDNNMLVGHISHTKLARYVLAEHRSEQSRRDILHRVANACVSDLMDSHFVYAKQQEELDNVLHRMLENDIEDLPVIDEQGKLCGLINLTEILVAVRRDQSSNEDAVI